MDFVSSHFPRSKCVRIYTCGPTIYASSHIGHARVFLAGNDLRSFLTYEGFQVQYIMNITNIDDKIIHQLAIHAPRSLQYDQEGYTKEELQWLNEREKEFFRDMDSLHISRPTDVTRVSDFIPDIIEYIAQIISNGFGYKSNGSVYFNLHKYQQEYKYPALKGKLSLHVETECTENKDKQSPHDFVLWKACKLGEPWWNSPWGKGRPGWHIECNAMSHAMVGQNLDIHIGGEDLMFPHHECEIAQANAFYNNGKPWVKQWVHVKHLEIEGKKMSKSLKNFVPISTLLQRITARQLKMCFLASSWQQRMHFREDEIIKEVKSHEGTFREALQDWEFKSTNVVLEEQLFQCVRQFQPNLLYRDLLNVSKQKPKPISKEFFLSLISLLGLNFQQDSDDSKVNKKMLDLLQGFRNEVRTIAKSSPDKLTKGELYNASDNLRTQLIKSGIHVSDNN